uniref:Uncharacterized protein n=1 Tax=Spumella elongata TaxID=89044 RepID=A0A7S3H6M8_9STRA
MPYLCNTNSNTHVRKLDSLSLIEVCELLQQSGLQDITPFVQAQNLTGLYLHDGVDHPQDLVDSGLNVIRAKTLFKRLVEWKTNGVPLDLNPSRICSYNIIEHLSNTHTDVSSSVMDRNTEESEPTYFNELDPSSLWMEQDYNAARWCSDASAVDRLLIAANNEKDPIAQMHLSLLYKHGCKHIRKDEQLSTDYATRALPWLQRQSSQGNPAAQYYYGYAFSHGLGVSEDKTEGARYYQLAADQGLAIALNTLGTCYLKGEGLPKYEEVGVSYLRKAVAAGSIAAEVNLALCYQNGFGLDVNELEMVKIYRKIAELGYANVQHYFGLYYLNGTEEKQNYTKALQWLKLSAEQDYVDAIVTLGYLYETGKGVEKDPAVALEYYQKGVALGSAYAADAVERVVDLVDVAGEI